MPKIAFETIDQIPEELREAATQDAEGKHVIDVSLSSKVKEFRDNNNAYKSQIENLQGFKQTVAQVAGFESPDEFDLEKFRENLAALRDIDGQVKAGKLIADSSLDAAVETRTAEMRGGYEKQRNELTRKIDDEKKRADITQERLHRYVVEAELTRAVMDPKSDVRPDALPDILNRAKGVFKVDPERLNVTPYGDDNQPMYGEDPTKAMSAAEWLRTQIDSSPYLSKSSNGGGSEGANKTGATSAKAANMPVGDYFKQRKAELAADAANNGR